MKRELKFRAWDDYSLVYSSEYEKNEFTNENLEEFFGDYFGSDITQFAGIQDKNEKDFYEGDIVTCHKDFKNYVVTWEYTGFRLARKITENGTAWQELMPQDEIIGNIFENPTLLKEPI